MHISSIRDGELHHRSICRFPTNRIVLKTVFIKQGAHGQWVTLSCHLGGILSPRRVIFTGKIFGRMSVWEKCLGICWGSSIGLFLRGKECDGRWPGLVSGSPCRITSLCVHRSWFEPPWLTHRHTHTQRRKGKQADRQTDRQTAFGELCTISQLS